MPPSIHRPRWYWKSCPGCCGADVCCSYNIHMCGFHGHQHDVLPSQPDPFHAFWISAHTEPWHYKLNFVQIWICPNPSGLVFLSQEEIGHKKKHQGFLRGSVIKNPPANAGDTDSIPDPGRFHMPGATKPMHPNYWVSALEPGSPNCWRLRASGPELHKRSHHTEKPCTAARVAPDDRN